MPKPSSITWITQWRRVTTLKPNANGWPRPSRAVGCGRHAVSISTSRSQLARLRMTTSLSEPDLVWRYFDCRSEGFFLEVGANEPKLRSQTWFLEQQGWHGILVEPQAALAEELRRQRPRSTLFQVACGPPGHAPYLPLHIAEAPSQSSLVRNLVHADTRYVRTELVPVWTLDAILAAAGHPAIDFLSIDVEGTQLEVLHGFSLERSRPRLLMIEDHL